jgi:hypothetical protein
MELQFEDNEYYLVDDNNDTIATTDKLFKEDKYMKKLSKENCDEIFEVVDVDKLGQKHYEVHIKRGHTQEDSLQRKIDFIIGFIKAMELNKDKLFTLDDMKEAYGRGFLQQGIKSFNSLIQSLQQPTEIEVEIEQELIQSSIQGEAIWELKLDENDCLILKRI